MKAAAQLASGSFEVSGQSYAFTLTQDGGGFKLVSAGTEYRLARKATAAPAAPAPAPASAGAAGSIVGSWRNATGSARFNADGTGVVDGTPGRYEIRGNQLTLIGAQGQATLPFEVRGDVLTLTVNGAAVTLNRVKEETGEGSVHMELVGKWCWISVTTANQGAFQSSRCITLNGNGTYAYAGATDSYNPYGGASSQSAGFRSDFGDHGEPGSVSIQPLHHAERQRDVCLRGRDRQLQPVRRGELAIGGLRDMDGDGDHADHAFARRQDHHLSLREAQSPEECARSHDRAGRADLRDGLQQGTVVGRAVGAHQGHFRMGCDGEPRGALARLPALTAIRHWRIMNMSGAD